MACAALATAAGQPADMGGVKDRLWRFICNVVLRTVKEKTAKIF